MMVMGKMFAMTNVRALKMEGELVPPFYFINLKCDPDKAVKLREEYPAIQAAWHQNKKHWNTLYMDDNLSDDLIKTLAKHSYDLVVASLPKKSREMLQSLPSH